MNTPPAPTTTTDNLASFVSPNGGSNSRSESIGMIDGLWLVC
ncbi:MAG: hypothetical protein ACR2OH_06875 [Microthrixaceae bacterium]